MFPESTRTRKAILAIAQEKIDQFGDFIEAAAGSLKISRKQLRRTRALLGKPGIQGFVPACDMEAAYLASEILLDLLTDKFKGAPDGRRFFWLTFAPDLGNALDRRPIINRRALSRLIDKGARKLKLSGVVGLEFQAITNYPGKGLGRAINFHGHMLAWTDDPAFDHREAEKALNATRAWHSALTSKPVKILPVNERAGIKRLATYMMKLPFEGKVRQRSKEYPGLWILASTLKGYRPELVLRLMEGLSQIPFTDLVFGVSGGTGIASEWRRRLRNELKAARAKRALIEPFDVARHWSKVNARRRNDNYAPFEFYDDATRPKPLPAVTGSKLGTAGCAHPRSRKKRTNAGGHAKLPTTPRGFSAGFIERRKYWAGRARKAMSEAGLELP